MSAEYIVKSNNAAGSDLYVPVNEDPFQTLKLQSLRIAIHAGETSGLGMDAAQVFDRLEKKYKSAATP